MFDPYSYLDAAAATLELPIPAQHRDGVAANLVRLHEMARDVIDFPLPDMESTSTGPTGASGPLPHPANRTSAGDSDPL